jgi:glycosyl transferase family 25
LKIFVISLANEHERRAAVARQLRTLRLEFEFFDAVRGTDDPFSHFSATSRWRYRLNSRREPLPNEVGCYASHLGMWRKCVTLDEPVVIMEDDFVAHDTFPAAVATAAELIDRFGFIRFEPFRRKRRPLRAQDGARKVLAADPFDLYFLTDPPLCLTAYALSPASAEALTRASDKLIGPVDKFVQRTWQHGVPLFALGPPSVAASGHASASTIGRRQEKSRNPALLLARLVYKGAARFRRSRFNARQLRSLDGAANATPR